MPLQAGFQAHIGAIFRAEKNLIELSPKSAEAGGKGLLRINLASPVSSASGGNPKKRRRIVGGKENDDSTPRRKRRTMSVRRPLASSSRQELTGEQIQLIS